jgi:CheY-like chemotaxis protein
VRRYARALTGDQATGDRYVRVALEALAAGERVLEAHLTPRVALYHVFHAIWCSTGAQLEGDRENGIDHDTGAADRLMRIAPRSRQAFLLTALEGFTPTEAAQILGARVEEVEGLIAEAQSEIESELATDVLIIEDEPVIAADIEALVRELGHRVLDLASTRTEALAAVAQKTPGLVLADIQLADGSSGVDAVKDILQRFNVPVIFITAFPGAAAHRRAPRAHLPDHQALPAGDGEGGDRTGALLPPDPHRPRRLIPSSARLGGAGAGGGGEGRVRRRVRPVAACAGERPFLKRGAGLRCRALVAPSQSPLGGCGVVSKASASRRSRPASALVVSSWPARAKYSPNSAMTASSSDAARTIRTGRSRKPCRARVSATRGAGGSMFGERSVMRSPEG